MSKKIGIFLMAILVLWSLLLLDATKNRRPPQTEVQPQGTTEAAMEPSNPDTTPPETTIPAAAPTEPVKLSQLEQVLARHTLNQTAVTHLVRSGTAGDSRTAELAALAAKKEMNPIAALWVLESEGLYQRDTDRPGLPQASLPELPAQTVKQYPYTDAGAAQLLTDWLKLAGDMELPMAKALLGEDGAVEPGHVALSEQDGCRYAYFACLMDRSAQILCIYLRADARGERITDVEFQLLHMIDGGDAKQVNEQAVTLAAAAELLMTGSARVEASRENYEVGGFSAEAERFFFTAEAEQGCLTNYRLRK